MATNLENYVGRTILVITLDGRQIVGVLKGFDQTINIVIDDCIERVYNRVTGVEQVPLGLYIMRGDNVRFGRRVLSTNSESVPNDKPITYTKSKAYTYKAAQSFRTTEDEITYSKHTSLIVKVSIAIFLIYFGVLREPNDIDEILGADLFDVMPELEIPMLENEIKRLEAHGINADELRKKLDSLKQLASAKTN
ncbi:U4/U6-U5 snRNP complex subunit lsm8 [Blomia tropicalis]|nr:U4/U6-U5 snRNP complex subunit lsm8 [Blomia tropicalis]